MKKFLSLMLSCALGLSLVACGTKEAAPSAEGGEATAVAYPTAPITAICPWSAGGGTDSFLRAICEPASKILGETISVNNVTGGGGATGHAAIMTAEPDGYTFGMMTFELNSLPCQGLIEFDYTDMDPLCLLNMDAAAITVPAAAPYDTLEEFIAYAKEHPGELTIGNSGAGAVWHIAAGLMEQTCGVSFKHVPYDGASPAVTDLVGGHIDGVSVSIAEVSQYVQAGQLKILGVMASERNAGFPDVPTFAECGYEGVEFGTWRGIAVPTGTPDEVKAVLKDALYQAYNDPNFQQIATNLNLGLNWKDTDEFVSFLASNKQMVEETMAAIGLI